MSEKIAQLTEWIRFLPMFIGVLVEGKDIKTPVKLSMSEERTLIFLFHEPDRSMTEYSRRLGITKGSFTTVVDRLCNRGYVYRDRMASDRRRQTIKLTPGGDEIARVIDQGYKDLISRKLALLDEEDIPELEQALKTIYQATMKLKDKKCKC